MNEKKQSERFTFTELERFMFDYLTAKLPNVSHDVFYEIVTTLCYKFALANADSLKEQERMITRAYERNVRQLQKRK